MGISTISVQGTNNLTLASKAELRKALANPNTVVLDVRDVDEIASTGYWKTDTRWANAPGTRSENKLLSVAANAIIPESNTPVIVYCARGFRAEKAKEVLEGQGYTNVMNAGGYPMDMKNIYE